ncbi:La domain-containing protein [Ceratobasidium sp. AG-Ba]|nr:La domain-containing protein [Ceratobasidium sp. AG-Ba]
MAAATETPTNTTDTTGVPQTDEERALKQFEFYFDDANLPYDKFMWKLHTSTPEHWVPIATVASFKRMREFQPKGADWLLSVLKKSDGLLEVDESGLKVRRAREIVEPKDQFERSIYAKGFPDETPELQTRLEEFFAKYGKVNAVRMRRTDGKQFKNSPTFDGTELLTMSKEAYCTMKIKEKGLDKKGITPRTHSGTGGPGGRRQFDAFQADNGVVPKKKGEKAPVTFTFFGKTYTVTGEGNVDIKIEEFEYPKGAAMKFTGAGDGETKFGELKTPLKERFNPLPFIKMEKGKPDGIFGFDATLSEEDIAFLREKVPAICGGDVTWELLADEAEREFQYWRLQDRAKRALVDSQAPKDSRSGRGGKGGRGGRGGRGGGRNSSGGRENKSNRKSTESKPKKEDAAMGEPVEALKAGKTRGEIEPSGESAGQGVRGAGVPSVGATKRKAEEGAGREEKKVKTE